MLDGRIMGLDIGDKTIGVAVSDIMGITAQGVKTIRRESKKKEHRKKEYRKTGTVSTKQMEKKTVKSTRKKYTQKPGGLQEHDTYQSAENAFRTYRK